MRSEYKAGLGLAVLAALSLAAAHPALAAVTVGVTDNSGGNYTPFGGGPIGAVPPLEYQQLYRPGAFSGITTINSVGFGLDNGLFNSNTPGAASYTGTLRFSVTPTAFNAPSATFASNVGTPYTTVFTGTLNTVLKNDGTFDLVFPTTPFVYNPASGTLLLDVQLTSETLPAGAGSANPEYFQFDGTGTSSSRVYTFAGQNVSRTGLVTQFGTANVVPESSGVTNMAGALLAVGFGALVMRGRRKATGKRTAA